MAHCAPWMLSIFVFVACILGDSIVMPCVLLRNWTTPTVDLNPLMHSLNIRNHICHHMILLQSISYTALPPAHIHAFTYVDERKCAFYIPRFFVLDQAQFTLRTCSSTHIHWYKRPNGSGVFGCIVYRFGCIATREKKSFLKKVAGLSYIQTKQRHIDLFKWRP